MENIIKENEKLVHKIANRYSHLGVPTEDLVQEGLLGLLEAVDKYDENKDAAFSTYAYYWIKKRIIEVTNAMKNGINQNKKFVSKIVVRVKKEDQQNKNYITIKNQISTKAQPNNKMVKI